MKRTPNPQKAIFLQAMEKTTAQERREFLDAACRDDSELRQQVDELLKSFSDAGSFLEAAAVVHVVGDAGRPKTVVAGRGGKLCR